MIYLRPSTCRSVMIVATALCLMSTLALAQPTITSFSPTNGPVGTSVTITGTNFSTTAANNIVYFGAVTATVTNATATALTVTAPAGSSNELITVTTGNLTAFSSLPFYFTFANNGNITTASFAAKVNFTVGSGPLRAMAKDLDGDGKPDLAVSNYNNGDGTNFSVLLNNSTGQSISFAPKTDFTTKAGPAGIASADLDGDGKPDIAIAHGASTGEVSIFRNTSTPGSLSFATRQDFTAGTNGTFMKIADLDKDGKPDLVSYRSQGLEFFRNTSTVGNISFAAKIDFATNISAQNFDVGDLDGDNMVDIAIPNFGPSPFDTPQITLFRNISTSGTISYAAGVNFTLPSGAGSIALGDLTGDGKLDIAFAGITEDKTFVFKNTSTTGTLTLDPAIEFSTPNGFRVMLSDVNGDTKTDMITLESNPNHIKVYKNTTTSAITFASSISPEPFVYTTHVMTADLNSDGLPDLIGFNNNTLTTQISVFRNLMSEPDIESFAPTTGKTGSAITITGSHFTGATAVTFGGVPASFVVNSPNSITAFVDAGASGSVEVTNPAGTNSLAGFTYDPSRPAIASFSPEAGMVGSSVTITGTNFNPTADNNVVYFGSQRAAITAASATSLTVTVPSASDYLPITVVTGNLSATAAKPFTVTFPGGEAFTPTTIGLVEKFTGSALQKSALGDFNADGKTDLVSINTLSNTISVFTNNSSGLITLLPEVDYATASGPSEVAVSDLDSDGKLDIVVNANGPISVFRNTSTDGTVSFAPKLDIPSDYGNRLVVADLDADGRPDILTSGRYSSPNYFFTIHRNVTGAGGAITFSPFVNSQIGEVIPGTLSTADLDGDGKPEILTSSVTTPLINIFSNISAPGTITLGSRSEIATEFAPSNVYPDDLDDDGKTDIIFTANSKISYYPNTSTVGNFTFASRKELASSSFEYFTLNDMNGDGKTDLVVTYQGRVALMRNTSLASTISFDAPVEYTAPGIASGMVTGDLDGNGKPEIILTSSVKNEGYIFKNQIDQPAITAVSPVKAGTGTVITITGQDFAGATAVSIGGVAAASFTVVSATQITAVLGSGASGAVTVTTSKGVASFLGFTYYDGRLIYTVSPLSAKPGATVAITGQGFGSTPAENVVRFGAVTAEVISATSSQIQVKVPTGATFHPVTVTSGNLTAYSSLSFTPTYSGMPALTPSSFAAKVDYTTMSGPVGIVIADLDGDFKPDLATVNNSNSVSIKQNTSSNNSLSFSSAFDMDTGDTPESIAAGDFNGDGKLDLLVANSSSSTVSVFRNSGIGGSLAFGFANDYPVGTNPQSVAVGDLDGDGKPDIATANFTGSNKVSILRNTTTTGISFAPVTDITAGSFPASVAIGDLDGDDKPEMIVANAVGNSISIFKNTSAPGTISFAAPTLHSTQNFPTSIAIGDMNNDGKPEIFVANESSSSVSVFVLNGSLSSRTDYPTGFNPNSVSLGDVNADGRFDIITANRSSANTVSVLRNTGSNFATKIDFTAGTEPASVAAGDLNGDGMTDIAIANSTGSSLSVLRNMSPTIFSFSPSAGGPGTTVTITGLNLTGALNVSFGLGAATTFTVVNPTTITAVVGTQSSSGNVTVTYDGVGALVSSPGFTFVPAPSLASMTPPSAGAGATVTITGTDLTNASAVSFGGTAATSFSVVSAVAITAVVGNGTTGSVSVTTPGGTATLAGFTFIPAPVISSFSPTSGGPETVVVITGTDLANASSVTFGGVEATSFTVISATRIEAKVGNTASGSVSVTTPGGTGTLVGFTFDGNITGIEYGRNDAEFSFSPNPYSGKQIDLHFGTSWIGKLARLDITDMTGKKIARSTFVCEPVTRWENKGEPLPSGFYILSVQYNNHKVVRKMSVK